MDDELGASSAPAGWYPDPSGEHAHRYYDGSAWTEHVAGGTPAPPVEATAPPPARDPGAPRPSVGPAVAVGLTWRASRRPQPTAGRALGAAAGVLFGSGVIGLGLEQRSSDGSSALGIVLSLALLAAAYVGVLRAEGPIRSASFAALLVAVPSFWLFAIVDDTFSDVTSMLLASAMVWAVLYVLGPTRSHSALLGAALAGGWLWVVAEAADNGISVDTPSGVETGVLSLAAGALYTAAGMVADRRALRSVAATCFAVGSAAIVLGVFVIGINNSSAAGGVIGVAGGFGYAVIGSLAGRRYTTWIGAAGVATGLAAIAFDIGGDDHRSLAAVLLLVGGLAALAASVTVSPRLGEAATEPQLEEASPAEARSGPEPAR